MKPVQLPVTKSDIIGQPEGDSGHKVVQLRGTRVAREKARSAALVASLPKGISIGQWHDERPSPYYVRYGRPRKVVSFADEQERNDQAEKLAAEKEAHGTAVLNFDPKEWREFQDWKARTKRTVPLVDEAVADYLVLRLAEDVKKDSDTHRHLKTHLGRLVTRFHGLRLDFITKEALRLWLGAIVSPRTGGVVSKVTEKNHRKDVNTFFKRCVVEEWLTKNPCEAIKPPKIDAIPKKPLAPREIFDLLKHNLDEPVVGRFVLELFGGLRCSSAERITADHVKWEAKGIAMPGQGHKSGSWKYRQGHPEVLWAWLKHSAPACFTEIHAGNYDHKKGQAFVRARVVNPGNVLRDSFASYYLALTKSYQIVGYLMQHTRVSTTMVYEGTADESDAKLVMAITPAAVRGTWEDFLPANKPKPVSP